MLQRIWLKKRKNGKRLCVWCKAGTFTTIKNFPSTIMLHGRLRLNNSLLPDKARVPYRYHVWFPTSNPFPLVITISVTTATKIQNKRDIIALDCLQKGGDGATMQPLKQRKSMKYFFKKCVGRESISITLQTMKQKRAIIRDLATMYRKRIEQRSSGISGEFQGITWCQ